MGEIIITIWFGVSVFIEITSSFVLRWWLRQRGVQFSYGIEGIPGIMERAYINWCRKQEQSPNKIILTFRGFSFINAIVAAVFLIFVAL